MNIDTLTFNMFGEHTYLLSDSTGRCAIVDPGNSTPAEDEYLSRFIAAKGYRPEAMWFTHLHLDHTFGSQYVADTYGLTPVAHAADLKQLALTPKAVAAFGLPPMPAPAAVSTFFADGDTIRFGRTELTVLHVPGHSAGCVALYSAADGVCLCGDTVFRFSVGRTDMPGGNGRLLLQSIRAKLLTLPRTTRLLPGHGPETTVGDEMAFNPYLNAV